MRVHCALYRRIPEDESPLCTIQENTWRWEATAHYNGDYLKMRVHCALYWRIPEDESPLRTILENTWRWESTAHSTGEYLKMRVHCTLYRRIPEDGFKSWGFVLTASIINTTHHMRDFQSSKNSYCVADAVCSVHLDRKIHSNSKECIFDT